MATMVIMARITIRTIIFTITMIVMPTTTMIITEKYTAIRVILTTSLIKAIKAKISIRFIIDT